MNPSLRGSVRILHLFGITVYLHWSWFLVAVLIIAGRGEFDAPTLLWNAATYLSLFALVLLHEFGHALACRAVAGKADTIVLWPLGGIAYVAPPARPGPVLWSSAGGPLVNLVFIVPLFAVCVVGTANGWEQTRPHLHHYFLSVAFVNLGLFVLNMLPIYPLDGGMILHAVLWFSMGRWRSLFVVSVFGLVFGGALVVGAFLLLVLSAGNGDLALFAGLCIVTAVMMMLRSLVAFRASQQFLTLAALPRHEAVRCPSCQEGPPRGPFWVCDHCQTRFDLFDHRGHCPACGAWYLNPACPRCYQASHVDQWLIPPEARRDDG